MAEQDSPSIAVDAVSKHFGRTRALDGTTFTVAQGAMHGFSGPNGAGKSRCIRILLGLLRQDSGTARVLGADPRSDAVAVHERLAYVPGDVSLWPNLTGGETIDVLTRGRRVDRDRIGHLCERFQLDPTKQGRTYSKGNRQKVAIVAALAVDVELLLLDEPTSGLDPLMEATFQDEIRRVNDDGTTVLLSSHILGQVEALRDRVSIIRHGPIVEDGTLAELRDDGTLLDGFLSTMLLIVGLLAASAAVQCMLRLRSEEDSPSRALPVDTHQPSPLAPNPCCVDARHRQRHDDGGNRRTRQRRRTRPTRRWPDPRHHRRRARPPPSRLAVHGDHCCCMDDRASSRDRGLVPRRSRHVRRAAR